MKILIACLCVTTASLASPPKKSPVSVTIDEKGSYKVQEFRRGGVLEKVEVRSGPGRYILRSKPKAWQQDEKHDVPLFQLHSW